MTATTQTRPEGGNAGGQGAGGQGAGGAFGSTLTAAVQSASDTVDRWSSKLEGVAGGSGSGGARQEAGVRAAKAGLQGKNPVWAAIKGAWAGGGTMTRAAVVTAGVTLLLALVLSPVLVLVFLLSALVIAAVEQVRSAIG
jgi:hypothetical protein